MGLEKCDICQESIRLEWKTLPDQSTICLACYKKIGYIPNSIVEAKQIIFKCDQYYDEHPEFVPTQKVGRVFGVDENAKEFVI